MGSRARLPVFINPALPLPRCAWLGGKVPTLVYSSVKWEHGIIYKVAVRTQRVNTCETLRAESGIDEALRECPFSSLLLEGVCRSIFIHAALIVLL